MKLVNFYTPLNDGRQAEQNSISIPDDSSWQNITASVVKFGLPVLKNMFMKAERLYNSKFYAFANTDNLFVDDLLPTLELIYKFHRSQHMEGTPLLIVGQRADVDMDKLINKDLFQQIDVKMAISALGTSHSAWGVEFLITTKGGFPWESLLDVVIGRPAWDNYVLGYAFDQGIPVYDVTETVGCMHQSYAGQYNSGSEMSKYPDVNKELIIFGSDKEKLNHYLNIGWVTGATYSTLWKPNGSFDISTHYVGEEKSENDQENNYFQK